VGHGLKLGQYDLCHACRAPISAEDKQSPHYEEGVSCPHCYNQRTEAQRHRYRERQRQAALAEKRGQTHLGDGAQG
ncbi:MAG: hypothetical protein M3036_18490, partial [Bifidobacteriales bacterium]|nr:hypothetical protein [Bifidobacteriales bacterium]